MKKLLLLASAIFSMIGNLQLMAANDTIPQPTEVIARKYDSNGEISREYNVGFRYDDNGKLAHYDAQEIGITGNFYYASDYLTHIRFYHDYGFPYPGAIESYNFSYSNDKMVTKSRVWSQINSCEYYQYEYDEYGRLIRTDYKEKEDSDWWGHWYYEYLDGGTTVVETYKESAPYTRYRTTSRYSEKYELLSSYTEYYNTDGSVKRTTTVTYNYDENGNLDTKESFTEKDGEIIESLIVKNIYDSNFQIIEIQKGVWSKDDQEWDINKKATYESSEDGLHMTISFYKKVNGEWVRDIFRGETLFFGSSYTWQKISLNNFFRDYLFNNTNINQFEMNFTYTGKPTYLSTTENGGEEVNVYPNPVTDKVHVKAPYEQSVLRFHDANGKIVWAGLFNQYKEISTSGWAQGLYFWEILQDGQRVEEGKLVKNAF